MAFSCFENREKWLFARSGYDGVTVACLQFASSLEVHQILIPSERVRKKMTVNRKGSRVKRERRFSSCTLPSRLVPILAVSSVLVIDALVVKFAWTYRVDSTSLNGFIYA